jgi:hypothetical protein
MVNESHVFGGLELNDGTDYSVIAHTFKPAQEKPDLVGGADSEGVVLARKPRPGPLEHELTVRIKQQATWDAAGQLVAAIVERAAECAMRPDGLGHVWTPQGATQAFTAYVLHAQVTEVPISQDSGPGWGWLARSPVLKIALTCKPYWYLPEVEGAPVTSSDSVVTVTVEDVPGDVDAEGRILVTNNEAVPLRHLEWGMESRLLDPSTACVIASGDLVTAVYYSGDHDTRTGAVDGDVVTAVVGVTPTPICAIAPQEHVGRFKVRARVWSSEADVRVRLLYRSGNRALEPTAVSWVSPVAEGFCDVDLGEIVVRPAVLGEQSWEGRFDAYNARADTTIEIDEVYVIPVERYGRVRAHYQHDVGLLMVEDRLDTVSGDLDGEMPRLGGVEWDSNGATTDFANSSALVSRSTTLDASPRIAIVQGSYTDIEVSTLYVVSGAAAGILTGAPRHHGVVARYTDLNNYLRLSHQVTTNSGDVWVEKVIGGAPTLLGELGGPLVVDTFYYLRLLVFSTGLGVATWISAGGATLDELMFQDDDLATGGTLEVGDVGIIDQNGSAVASERFYGAFSAAIPPAEPVAINAALSLELRHDGVLREGAGDLWGEPWYRGDRVLIPPAGVMNRDTRIAVKARVDDVDVMNNTETGASTTVQVNYTPRSRMPARTA